MAIKFRTKAEADRYNRARQDLIEAITDHAMATAAAYAEAERARAEGIYDALEAVEYVSQMPLTTG